MRILFCNYEYPPLGGGGGVVNAWLAEELAKRHDVTVLTSRAFDLPDHEIVNGVRVLRTPVFFRTQHAAANFPSMLMYLPTATLAGWKLLNREAFDIVNTHFVLPTGPVGASLAWHAGIPNVLSVHGGDLYDPSKRMSPHRYAPLRAMIRFLANRADAIVGQSRNTLENLNTFYLPQAQGIRIPLGINRPNIKVTSRASFGFDEQDLLLVTVGRLVARKAIEQLIETMAAVHAGSAGKRVRLLIIGTGPEQDRLTKLAVDMGVSEAIHFLGHVDEETKLGVLAMSDLFVSTSQHEGFGLVFLEAMACGLPVICYDHGGQTDFMTSGETGYLVPLNNQQTFVQQCTDLISNAPLRQEMGRRNTAVAEDLFIDRCAASYLELFDQTIEEFASTKRAVQSK